MDDFFEGHPKTTHYHPYPLPSHCLYHLLPVQSRCLHCHTITNKTFSLQELPLEQCVPLGHCNPTLTFTITHYYHTLHNLSKPPPVQQLINKSQLLKHLLLPYMITLPYTFHHIKKSTLTMPLILKIARSFKILQSLLYIGLKFDSKSSKKFKRQILLKGRKMLKYHIVSHKLNGMGLYIYIYR